MSEAILNTKRIVIFFVFIVIIAASCIALYPRVKVEQNNKNVAIYVDYRDIVMLAMNTNKEAEEVLEYLIDCGITGLMVSELTGELLSSGGLPIFYGSPESVEETRFSGLRGSLIVIPEGLSYKDDMLELLDIRFGAKPIQLSQGTGILLPFSNNKDMEKFGVVPDLEGLYIANELGLPVFWRVAQALNGETQDALNMHSRILEKFKNISVVAPVGDIALGFPNMSLLAGILNKNGVPAAQVEFTRQLGANQISRLMYPNIIPLHSVTQEEITSRNLTRLALHERLVRAATERSVRMLMFRPSQSGTSRNPLNDFGDEVIKLKEALTVRGLTVKETENAFRGVNWNNPFYGILACGLMLLFTLFSYYMRYNSNKDDKLSVKLILVFTICAAFLLPAMYYSQKILVYVGALVAILVVVEASIVAMDPERTNFNSILKGFFIAVVGGLSIAALFSNPLYILRINVFSGVKTMLVLPPVLVLLYDFQKRIHPESLRDVLSRPPLWGELILAGVLIIGAGIILFRSDNVRIIPGIEAKAREFLERTLIARPRNKEIFLGFPCLIFYYYVIRKGMWVHYREALRLAVVIGFSSVVNSFCHFHTPLFFILIRQINGLWLGVTIGIILVAVYNYCFIPLYNRYKGVFG